MKQDVYLCEQKGRVFIKIETEENIQKLIELDKDENRSEFVKYLQLNDPPGFNEFKARKLDPNKDFIKEPVSISFKMVEEVDIEYLERKIRHLNINSINIRDGKLDITLPKYITDNVEYFFCGGKASGVIDLDLYKNLIEINILDWNSKIKIKNNICNNKVNKLIVWYHKPKDKRLSSLIEHLPNLKYLELNHTNIECLEGIENQKILQEIIINYGRNLKFVSYLNKCEKLEKVILNHCNKIEDIKGLEQLSHLYIKNTKLSG